MTSPPPRRSPYATFRPVGGAWVARIMAVASLLVFGYVGIFGQMHLGSSAELELLNRIGIVTMGALLAAVMWRYAVIRAIPSTEGLRVVNLFRTYDLEWAQIIGVAFGGGAPWPVLELTDTEELAVMAIQRSDGDRSRQEASRLAALIAHHQGVDPQR